MKTPGPSKDELRADSRAIRSDIVRPSQDRSGVLTERMSGNITGIETQLVKQLNDTKDRLDHEERIQSLKAGYRAPSRNCGLELTSVFIPRLQLRCPRAIFR